MHYRITADWRMTIPKWLREEWGVGPGDPINIDVEDGRLVMVPANAQPGTRKAIITPVPETQRRPTRR
jgi:AbrB family looped-hinge helix DNA binding protein